MSILDYIVGGLLAFALAIKVVEVLYPVYWRLKLALIYRWERRKEKQ